MEIINQHNPQSPPSQRQGCYAGVWLLSQNDRKRVRGRANENVSETDGKTVIHEKRETAL